MRTLIILLSGLAAGVIIGFFVWDFQPDIWTQSSGKAFIKVLPAEDETGIAAKDTQSQLILNEDILKGLVEKERIQQTKWFQKFGGSKAHNLNAAVADLKKRLHVRCPEGTNLIVLSMAGDEEDASAIVNELARWFVQVQTAAKKKQITKKLMFLDENLSRLQRDLDLSERELEAVRSRYGIYDLQQNNQPHPVTARLIRLQAEQDDCSLLMAQLRARLDTLLPQPDDSSSNGPQVNAGANTENIQVELKVLQSRLKELDRMFQQAQKKQQDLDIARTQYAQRRKIRDERQQVLNLLKRRIEELKIRYDDPCISGLEVVGDDSITASPAL